MCLIRLHETLALELLRADYIRIGIVYSPQNDGDYEILSVPRFRSYMHGH